MTDEKRTRVEDLKKELKQRPIRKADVMTEAEKEKTQTIYIKALEIGINLRMTDDYNTSSNK